jgi:hypothetical protein
MIGYNSWVVGYRWVRTCQKRGFKMQKCSDFFSGSHSFHCVRRLHCVLTIRELIVILITNVIFMAYEGTGEIKKHLEYWSPILDRDK